MQLPPPQTIVYSDNECSICHDPLILPNSHDDPLDPSYVIDDVELSCTHHFHQSCILEYAASSDEAREHCALCRAKVTDNYGCFWVTVRTENGFVGKIDLGKDIDEQAYLRANPEIGRARAFLALMSFSKLEEAEKFLKEQEGSGNIQPLDPNVT